VAEITNVGIRSVASALTPVANRISGLPAAAGSAARDAWSVGADGGPDDEEIVGAHILAAAALAAEELLPDAPGAIYFRDIGRIPLLVAEEEVDLARALEHGDAAGRELAHGGFLPREELRLRDELVAGAEARRRLTESNLRLVVSVARKYIGRGLPLLDLIQEGNIGLSRAVDKYDWRKGFRFSTYAYWWIRQAVTRAIADDARTIRLPTNASQLLSSIARTRLELAAELGREPALSEVAEHLQLPLVRLVEIVRAAQLPISLDSPLGEDGDTSVGDLLADTEATDVEVEVERSDLALQLAVALRETLSERERAVLQLRFGLGGGEARALGEISHGLGISRERVRQIEVTALRKLRRTGLRARLVEYVEG
jgi:RNA polymerase primary sigma factor